MGLFQSSERKEEEEEEEDRDLLLEEQGDGDEEEELEQEEELISFDGSSSPLSPPKLSAASSPHLACSGRIWEHCHLLCPFPVHAQTFKRRISSSRSQLPAHQEDDNYTEIYLIRHAESTANVLPDLIAGRSPSALLSAEGKRQARALGVFLLSQGLHFDAVFASPLERCKQTAISVCQEVNFPQERIEFADALMEMSQGHWEGLRRSEIYTDELVNMNNAHPDFHAPGGETQRQVEFRMVEFLNNSVLPRAAKVPYPQKYVRGEIKKQSKPNSLMQVHPLDDGDDETNFSVVEMPKLRDAEAKGSRRSNPQISSMGQSGTLDASTKGNHGISSVSSTTARSQVLHVQRRASRTNTPFCVGVFSHGMAIKCLLRGLLGSDSCMTLKLCIDNTSVTVLRHSPANGWQIQRINDIAHLFLL